MGLDDDDEDDDPMVLAAENELSARAVILCLSCAGVTAVVVAGMGTALPPPFVDVLLREGEGERDSPRVGREREGLW